MSDLDMAKALSWNEEFDLGEQIEEMKTPLQRLGWEDIPDNTILKLIANAAQLDPIKYDVEKLSKKVQEDVSIVKIARENIVKAVTLFNSLGFRGPGTLPYEWVLVLLTRAYIRFPRFSMERKASLQQWVAEKCIRERFKAAPPHVLSAIWKGLENRLTKKTETNTEKREAKECLNFSMAWARSRVTAVVMAGKSPRNSSNEAIHEPERLLSKEGTGVIPKLFTKGAEGQPEGLVPQKSTTSPKLLDLLKGPANRVICDTVDLASLRKKLFDNYPPPEFLSSHSITQEAWKCLQEKKLDEFLEKRKEAIKEAELEWLKRWGVEYVSFGN